MSQKLLSEILHTQKDILDELKHQNRLVSELWNAQDIAHFMRISKSSVQSRIITRSDFPPAITFPTGGRRWQALQVRQWVKHYQRK